MPRLPFDERKMLYECDEREGLPIIGLQELFGLGYSAGYTQIGRGGAMTFH